jgi:hypothetical protein
MGQVFGRLQVLFKGLTATGTKEEVGFQLPGALGTGNQVRRWLLVRVMVHFLTQVVPAKRTKEGITLQLPGTSGAESGAWLQMLSQRSIFLLALAAMGTEGEPLLHFLGTMETIKFFRGRRQGRIQDLLVLLGKIGAGLAQLGHPFADFFRDLRQSLRPEKDQGQN